MTESPDGAAEPTINPLAFIRRADLAAELRRLADRLECLESTRPEVSDLAIDMEIAIDWLRGARQRVLEYRRSLPVGEP